MKHIRNTPCFCTIDNWLTEDGCPCRDYEGYAISGYHLWRIARWILENLRRANQ